MLANFDDDAFFRVAAMHCVLDTVSAERVNYIDGWFTANTELKDARQLRHFTGVSSVDNGLFKGCTALERVVMPSGLTALGDSAFAGCTNLNYIDMTGCSNLDINDFDRKDGIFVGTPLRTLVYMPQGNSQTFDEVNVVNTPAEETEDTVTSAYSKKYYIEDKTAVDVPRPFHANEAQTTRKFTPGEGTTIFLPYGLSEKEAAALGKFFVFESYNASTQEATFTRVEKTEPNTAYVFVPDVTEFTTGEVDVAVSRESDPNEVKMVGTYHDLTIGENPWAYGYAGTTGDNSTTGKLVKLSATDIIPPTQAYLITRGLTGPSFGVEFVDGGSTSGIGHVTNNELDADAPVDVFTIDGRKVRSAVNSSECLSGLPSGIYVVKGKKYLVK